MVDDHAVKMKLLDGYQEILEYLVTQGVDARNTHTEAIAAICARTLREAQVLNTLK
jgi:hypothetical protein